MKNVNRKKRNGIMAALCLAAALTACGQKTVSPEGEYGDGVTLKEVKTAVTDTLGDHYWPNTPVSKQSLQNTYGLSEDMYDEILAEIPMLDENVDTLIVVKAKKDKVEDVEAALDGYREKMIKDNMQYPSNLGKVQASRIEIYGNYVCFVQLGADTTAAMESGEEAVMLQCQEENERALYAIEQALAP